MTEIKQAREKVRLEWWEDIRRMEESNESLPQLAFSMYKNASATNKTPDTEQKITYPNPPPPPPLSLEPLPP